MQKKAREVLMTAIMRHSRSPRMRLNQTSHVNTIQYERLVSSFAAGLFESETLL